MGLPLALVLLESAVASLLAIAALANADCVYFYARALLEKAVTTMGGPRLAR
jgi:hypothetical protein